MKNTIIKKYISYIDNKISIIEIVKKDSLFTLFHNKYGAARIRYHSDGKVEYVDFYLNGLLHNNIREASFDYNYYDNNKSYILKRYFLYGENLIQIKSNKQLKKIY